VVVVVVVVVVFLLLFKAFLPRRYTCPHASLQLAQETASGYGWRPNARRLRSSKGLGGRARSSAAVSAAFFESSSLSFSFMLAASLGRCHACSHAVFVLGG
jgi:hypothetical protein